MDKKLTCPVCDSNDIHTDENKVKEKVSITGVQMSYSQTIHVCQVCGEKGEFCHDISKKKS